MLEEIRQRCISRTQIGKRVMTDFGAALPVNVITNGDIEIIKEIFATRQIQSAKNVSDRYYELTGQMIKCRLQLPSKLNEEVFDWSALAAVGNTGYAASPSFVYHNVPVGQRGTIYSFLMKIRKYLYGESDNGPDNLNDYVTSQLLTSYMLNDASENIMIKRLTYLRNNCSTLNFLRAVFAAIEDNVGVLSVGLTSSTNFWYQSLNFAKAIHQIWTDYSIFVTYSYSNATRNDEDIVVQMRYVFEYLLPRSIVNEE